MEMQYYGFNVRLKKKLDVAVSLYCQIYTVPLDMWDSCYFKMEIRHGAEYSTPANS